MDACGCAGIQARWGRSRDRISRLRQLAPCSLAAALAALGGCGPTEAPGRIALDRADALWGGDAGFCARTALGLACWTSGRRPGARGPAIVTGLDRVTDLAIVRGEACALHAGDVACFVPGDTEPRGRSFDQPTRLAAIDPATLCVSHASGVSCWSAGQAPAPRVDVVLPASTGAASATDGRHLCTLGRSGEVTCAPRWLP